MKIAGLMLTGSDFYGRAAICHQTWLRECDAFQIHSFTPCKNPPITVCGSREGWHSCFDKRHHGLEIAWRTLSKCDWFLCCSCDAYFWIRRLRKVLETMNPSVPMVIGGPRFQEFLRDGTFVIYPPGGAGYCFSRIAMSLLLHNIWRLRSEWRERFGPYESEDVFNGWACEKLRIRYIEHPGFHQVPPGHIACNRVWPLQTSEEKVISIHYLRADEILEIWKSGGNWTHLKRFE